MKCFYVLILSFLASTLAAWTGCGWSAGASGVPMGTTASGMPVGLFFMTRYWGYTGTLEKAAWYFAPDGTVYQNLETGFSANDLAAHTGPRGTFRVTGSDMEVIWADGKTSKSNYQPDKSGFSWDAGTFSPVQPIKDKQSIAGTYDGGESLSRRGDWAAVAKKLTLGADGSYRLDGVAVVQGETDYAVLTAGAEKSTSGTWDVSGYSLTFKDEGGKSVRQIAFPFDDDSTAIYPDHLFIGGTLYKHLP
jgi:hypothetical protein